MAKSEGKKGRKLGRNKVKCERYRARGTREANKRRRAERRARWLAKREQRNEQLERERRVISEQPDGWLDDLEDAA